MDALTPQKRQTADTAADCSSTITDSTDTHIEWFRQASPYINAHRGKTVVLCVAGTALASAHFPTLVHDITLLKNLGIKLVLVFGLRPQIDSKLASMGESSQFKNGLRITTDEQLELIVSEVGRARIYIESRLSMGLPNTPMSGIRITIASGNFVTAQPYGVVDGLDHCHTGVVRQVHANAIRRQIDNEQIVLLSPIGYSRTGEMFNLEATDVATQAAIALSADKLIFICEQNITGENDQVVRDSTPSKLADIIDGYAVNDPARLMASKAIQACRSGVNRAHILQQSDANALLKELYTRDGSGTMVYADNYETLRAATIQDVGGIIELIKPLESDGTLVKRSREQLELDIEKFRVIERDGLIITCAALLVDSQNPGIAELACLATHADYRKGGRAEALLSHIEKLARDRKLETLYVLTTRSDHWFIEHGFNTVTADVIPKQRRESLNTNRNSKVLLKRL